MKSLIFKRPLRVFYSEDYTMGEGLETVTKSKLLAKMITDGKVSGVELVAPKLATEEELLLIHSPEYVGRVLNGETQLGECPRGQVGKVTRGQGEMSGRDAVAPLPTNLVGEGFVGTGGNCQTLLEVSCPVISDRAWR